MSGERQIFVRLLDEGVDVWRPVLAEYVKGNIYRIVDQEYAQDTETWEFVAGQTVECELVDSAEGAMLTAVRRLG